MDDDISKARSIELAERAYRLKDKAKDDFIKERFDKAADTLIQVDQADRFYRAQSKLEKDNIWVEEMRSLAHEINMADQNVRHTQPLSFASAMETLEQWNRGYLSSSRVEIQNTAISIDDALASLYSNPSASDEKQCLNYLLTFCEAVLSHIQAESDDTKIDQPVIILRNIRDALLVKRELAIDDAELIAANVSENQDIDRIKLARESLKEIYATIAPVQIPT